MNDPDLYMQYLHSLDLARRRERRWLSVLTAIAIGGSLAMLWAIGAFP